MSLHPATTRFIKTGRSTPYLLFFGNRKQDENETVKELPTLFISVLMVLVLAVLGICVYAFLTGKLG